MYSYFVGGTGGTCGGTGCSGLGRVQGSGLWNIRLYNLLIRVSFIVLLRYLS